MKLLHIETRQVVQVLNLHPPPYAILSRTWGGQDGLTLAPRPGDLERRGCLPVDERVIRACPPTYVSHLWVSCLCIDSSSSADLDEAVNGSWRRLRKSSVCLAYLDDLPADGPPLDCMSGASFGEVLTGRSLYLLTPDLPSLIDCTIMPISVPILAEVFYRFDGWRSNARNIWASHRS